MLFERAIVKMYFVGAILKMCYFWKTIVEKVFSKTAILRSGYQVKAFWESNLENALCGSNFDNAFFLKE